MSLDYEDEVFSVLESGTHYSASEIARRLETKWEEEGLKTLKFFKKRASTARIYPALVRLEERGDIERKRLKPVGNAPVFIGYRKIH